MDRNENDQFRRMELATKAERAGEMIEQYFDGIRFYRDEIAQYNREMGKIDQRAGG